MVLFKKIVSFSKKCMDANGLVHDWAAWGAFVKSGRSWEDSQVTARLIMFVVKGGMLITFKGLWVQILIYDICKGYSLTWPLSYFVGGFFFYYFL